MSYGAPTLGNFNERGTEQILQGDDGSNTPTDIINKKLNDLFSLSDRDGWKFLQDPH